MGRNQTDRTPYHATRKVVEEKGWDTLSMRLHVDTTVSITNSAKTEMDLGTKILAMRTKVEPSRSRT